MRNILCNVINPISPGKAEFLPKQIISIDGGIIISITPADSANLNGVEDYSDCLALPGFIDLHVHLSQYRIRGMYQPALLPWLSKFVFPEEARSAQIDYATDLAIQFYKAMWKAGTTMSVIYTAPSEVACGTAFAVAEDMGVRAMIGMTMMDQNSPEGIQQSSTNSLDTSFALYDRWHGKSSLLDYIFTPRFAPTCSMQLMQEVAKFARSNNAWIQTHLSENLDELHWVKELFGLDSYTQVYEKAGLITPKSIFGHAIHLSDKELNMLKDNESKIAHCPDSNFYLKSGEYPLQRMLDAELEFGLGSDVGAGTTLNMLHHAQMMNFRQSKLPVLPTNALYHITLGSAKLLGMDKQIGSLKPGKDADIVLIKPPDGYPISEQSLSQLIFFGSEFEVMETLVAGRIVHSA